MDKFLKKLSFALVWKTLRGDDCQALIEGITLLWNYVLVSTLKMFFSELVHIADFLKSIVFCKYSYFMREMHSRVIKIFTSIVIFLLSIHKYKNRFQKNFLSVIYQYAMQPNSTAIFNLSHFQVKNLLYQTRSSKNIFDVTISVTTI